MLRACIATLFAITLMVITSEVYAEKSLTLSPNESKQLTNHYLWTLNATCNIQGNDAKNRIRVRVLENKGSVNGKSLSKGQATSFNVRNKQSISVSADPGTTVNLTNLGTVSVHAVCNA